MKKLLIFTAGVVLTLLLLSAASVARGATILFPTGGGTGSSTLTGILLGNGTAAVRSLNIGTGLSLVGTTLSNIASTFGYPFPGNATTTQITFSGGIVGNVTGNASTATILQTTRTINGVNFNGSANITINAASSTLLGDSNTFSGNNIFSSLITGSVSGNAGTATKLATPRNINGVPFDGSAAITINAASSSLLGDSNTFSGTLNKFSNAPALAITGLIKGNGSSAITAAVAGTDFQAPITLTTTGSSGAATFIGNTLNVPQYAGTTYTPTWPITLTGSAFGFDGLSTTTNLTQGFLPYVTGVKTFGQVATTSVTCTGNATCSSFTAIGPSPITINVAAGTAASSTLLADSNTFSGNNVFSQLITGSVSGNAGTATKLATGRTIAITGDLAYTSPSFDGSGNVTAGGTLATVNSNVGTFTNATFTVNGKGLVTAASSGAAPVTGVTATNPLFSSGGATPNISTIFSTTTTFGLGNNGFFVADATGKPFVAASSTLNLPNTALQNSSLTVNGSSISLGGSATVTANTTNALTFNNSGSGAASGTTFNGGTAQTISYNTIGAQVAGTYVTSVTGTTNRITSSGGTTPAIDISAAYVGQSSITTLGTITTGVWNGTAIANANLANSTISGVALGGTLNSLSHDGSFSGTSYNGSATISNWGLNLANANIWTALQTFGNASSTLFSTTYGSTTNEFVGTLNLPLITGTQCLHSISGVVSGTGSDCGAGGGGSPGGTGTELQYRTGASSFGAIALSAYNLAANWLGFGTSTPHWVTQFSTSTAPQLALTSSSASGNFHWTFNNIFGNLFFATSSATTFATSTTNGQQGFIEFPNNGGCIGCADVILTGGINLRNAQYVSASSSAPAANTMQDIYTVPAGRRAYIQTADLLPYNVSTAFGIYVKISGVYYHINGTTTSSGGTQQVEGIVLEPGEGVAVLNSLASKNEWVNMITFDSSVPFYSPRIFSLPIGTTTVYTVPTGRSALMLGRNPVAPGNNTSPAYYLSVNIGNAGTVNLFRVVNGGIPSNTVNIFGSNGASAGFVTDLSPYNSINFFPYPSLNSGDSIQISSTGSLTGLLGWMNVYEH